MVRSLVLGDRVAEDAALWGLRVFVAAGREKTCPLSEEKGDAVHDFCRYFRYKCPYARLPPSLPPATSWRELVLKGREEGWCPYFAQDLVSDAAIIVQNYFRRTRPAKAFIIDEAHNLLIPEEKEIPISRLAEAIAASRERGASERLLRHLSSALHYILVKDGDLDLRLFLQESDIDEIRRLHFTALEEGDRRIKPLMDLVRAAALYVEGERIYLYKPPLLHPYRPAVFVSATLPPEASAFLQTDVEIRIPWTTKPKAVIAEDVTTRYEEYDGRMAARYKKLLVEVGRRYRRVLVFAASERVARDLRAWVQYEESVPPSDWEGILLLRARGRFAEGVNLDADAVVIAGAPFLPPSVSSRLARAYKSLGHADPLRAAIDTPMLVATLQCIGRAWRTPERAPYVFLADWRYEKYVSTLSDYLDLR
jgi:DNA excision repair protein ERCC-2